MLNNYFELGRLVDTLHKDGYSYREIERDLRNTESNEWILRHTTLFSAHKFYLAVKSYFNSDVEEFLKKNPDIISRELSHQILSCHRLVGCPTVEQKNIYLQHNL